jgi:hypothetical protein
LLAGFFVFAGKEKAAAFGGGAWGVLAVNENHKVEVAKTAVKLPGMMKGRHLRH